MCEMTKHKTQSVYPARSAREQQHGGVEKRISLISLNTNERWNDGDPGSGAETGELCEPLSIFPHCSNFLSHVAHAHRFRRRGQHLSTVHHLYQRQVPHRQNHAEDACVWRGRHKRKKEEEEVGTVSFVSDFMRLMINNNERLYFPLPPPRLRDFLRPPFVVIPPPISDPLRCVHAYVPVL